MALQHSAAIPSHPQANLSGWFDRHTSLWPVRRWLELRGPTLTYRHSRNSPPQWSVDLRECRVAAGSRARELVLERPSHPKLSLFAPSLAELKLWFTELKRVSDGIHDFYHLAAQISHSAHGPIVLGRERTTDEQAAVFIQRKSEMSAWTMWALTRRDERVLRLSQSHPSTVEVRDVFETTRLFYVVTELVTGGPLRDALTRAGGGAAGVKPGGDTVGGSARGGGAPLGAAVALSVASDVLRALAHLHAGGVVHGCVDASHVLCVGGLPGRVKLVVFGVAAGMREAGAFGRGPGVAGDAPEVVCFRRRSGASDVFSAGVLLFELLTGVRPFGAGSVSEERFLANVAKGPPGAGLRRINRRRDIDDDDDGGGGGDGDGNMDEERALAVVAWNRLGAARSLLERMLHEDPVKRPTAVECLKHEWFDGVSGGRTQPLARYGSDPKTVILDFDDAVARGARLSQETDGMEDRDYDDDDDEHEDRSYMGSGSGSGSEERGSDDDMNETIPTVDEDEDEDEAVDENVRERPGVVGSSGMSVADLVNRLNK